MKHTNKDAILRNQAVWGATPAIHMYAADKTPGTKEYFDQVINNRFISHYWLAQFVDYSSWKYKKVLEVGCGAGADAYMFCKNGAEYTGIDVTHTSVSLTKSNLAFYKLSARVLQMDAVTITLQEKFDLIYSLGVLHHIPDIELALRNIHAVLADDGMFYLVIYNKNSIFYRIFLSWSWLTEGYFLKETFKKRLSRIELTTSTELPHVDVYSKKDIKKLLQKVGFTVVSAEINQLDKDQMPNIWKLWKIWAKIPTSFYRWLGRYFGWYVCIKAKKRQ